MFSIGLSSMGFPKESKVQRYKPANVAIRKTRHWEVSHWAQSGAMSSRRCSMQGLQTALKIYTILLCRVSSRMMAASSSGETTSGTAAFTSSNVGISSSDCEPRLQPWKAINAMPRKRAARSLRWECTCMIVIISILISDCKVTHFFSNCEYLE